MATRKRTASHRRRRRKTKKSPRTALLIAVVLAVLAALLLLPGREGAKAPYVSPLPANPYTPEDFAWEKGYLTCTGANSRLGIDVSEHQGDIDWQQVADAGMEFAMVRIGYRGYSEGSVNTDPTADANIRGAREAGLDVGVYFYSQAVTIEEAAQEALFCIRFLQDYEIQMPVVFDWEYVSADARTGDMDRETLTRCVQVFCDTVEKSGYEAMVYFNPSIGSSLMDLGKLLDYPWWLAMYTDRMDYPYAVQMWQYTENGSVPGIDGDVDINIQFLD